MPPSDSRPLPFTRDELAAAVRRALADTYRRSGLAIPAGLFAADANGAEHKGKGSPDGGQFAPKGKGDKKPAGKPSGKAADKSTGKTAAPPKPRKAATGDTTTPHLTPAEQKAVESYKQGGYNRINHELRSDGQRTTGGMPNPDGALSQRTAEVVKGIDPALAKAKLSAPMTVYRGYGGHMMLEEFGFDHGMKAGDVLTDRGYVSTSEDPAVAARWGQDGNYVYAEIRLPAGMSALHLDPYTTHQTREDEVLLPRNTRFKVVSKTPAAGGKGYKLVLEAMPATA